MSCGSLLLPNPTDPPNLRTPQTAKSVLESNRVLDKELTERGVPRPVVILTENLSSRKDEAVLNFCQEVGIRQFFELPDTSGLSSGILLPPPSLSPTISLFGCLFLIAVVMTQARGQINKKCHEAYKKAKKRWKLEL